MKTSNTFLVCKTIVHNRARRMASSNLLRTGFVPLAQPTGNERRPKTLDFRLNCACLVFSVRLAFYLSFRESLVPSSLRSKGRKLEIVSCHVSGITSSYEAMPLTYKGARRDIFVTRAAIVSQHNSSWWGRYFVSDIRGADQLDSPSKYACLAVVYVVDKLCLLHEAKLEHRSPISFWCTTRKSLTRIAAWYYDTKRTSKLNSNLLQCGIIIWYKIYKFLWLLKPIW